MRFIGYHYPVKVYRDVVYYKEHKVLRKVQKAAASLRQSRRRDSKSSTMSDEDDLLTRLLGAHHLIDRIKEVEESKESEEAVAP